jgi:membrane protease YdiL (CAAX protease family)
MVALPAAYILHQRRRLSDYLIQAGEWKTGLKVSAALIVIALPVMHFGSTLPEFQEYYPTWGPASESLQNFILFEVYVFAIMLCTEFFYRGFLLNALLRETRYGNVIHAFIYMLAHIGKPDLEVIYSLPVGWLFGKIDLKCRSILPSLLMHYTSSIIFDLMILNQRGVGWI